jgi:hypothetical protein
MIEENFDKISEEEKIVKFVEELFQGRKNELLQQSQGYYGELFDLDKKKTPAQHEILINVVFHVLSLDAETQNQTTSKMVEQNFYIPLPGKENFDKYVQKFDEVLKKAIVEASNSII